MLLSVIIGLICIIASTHGHARLQDPIPLNPNPVVTSTCGVATMPNPTTAKPSATWVVGQSVTVQWLLIAGDGGNAVTGKIDPNGGTTFSTNAWTSTKPIGTAIQAYPLTFTVPAVTCPNGVCTFQVSSNTGWASCAFVNITTCQSCPEPTPSPGTCVVLNTDLDFCVEQSNSDVFVPLNGDPTVIDADAYQTWETNLNKTTVFANGLDATCRQDYRKFLCSLVLPPCAGTGETTAVGAACRADCRTTMSSCQLTELHAALYDCNTLPLCPGESSSSLLSPSLAAFAALLIGVVALLI